MFKFLWWPFFLKCREICIEAIEMPPSAGRVPKTTEFGAVICILQ